MIKGSATLSGRRVVIGVKKLWSVTIVAVLVLVGGYYVHEKNQPGSLVLRFRAFVEDAPLILNQIRYGNPGGDGEFKVRDFRFFLSNIRLVSGSEEYSVPESYHLVRFDGETKIYQLALDNIPRRPYTEIQFGIGVDKIANSSIESVGDLDPNSRMAWSWDVGYKFILLEGGLLLNDELSPLVYHVGFDENYKPIAVGLEEPLFGQRSQSLTFKVDIMKLFKGTDTIDMSALPSVKFDRADARLIAGNYETMITLCAQPDC